MTSSSTSRLVRVFAVLACASFELSAARAELPETVDFNFHIRPLLSDRCFACHGPDEEDREAELRLDLEESAYAALEGGEASHIIKPGDPLQSEVYLRIAAEDADERMPPADSNLVLSAEEIQLVRRWIEQGARWKQHWSFMPIEPVKVPELADSNWPRNEIDQFVLARLQSEGLQPAAEATREKLIRRVTYDLTGLPPTLEEIDDFLADDAADAYESVVDRLLNSPRYGERMAVEWLDVARYADTYGYQADRYRAVWPYRDWVVDAFNQNLPYDEFVTWQLAGDLLPGDEKAKTLATAFNRLHRQTNEGGSIEEEFRVEYVADRTETFATAFLGLTFQCARCHDHKYDPLTQKDYYQIFSFFGSIDECGLYSHFTEATPTPTLLLTEPQQESQLAELAQAVGDAENRLQEIADQQQSAFEAWLAESPQLESIAGLIGDYPMEQIVDGKLVNRADADQPGQVADAPALVAGKVGQGLHLSGENNFTTPVGGTFSRHDPFTISLWINTPDEKDRAVVWHRSRSWTDAGSRGYQLLFEDGKLSASLIHFWPGNALRVRTNRKLSTNSWQQVTVTYDGSSRADGLKLYINGKLEPCEVVRDQLTKTIGYNSGEVETKVLTLGQRFRDRGFKDGLVDELQIYNRELTPAEVEHVHSGASLGDLLVQSDPARSTLLRDYYLKNYSEPYRMALAELRDARLKHGELIDSIAEIMVMRELSTPRPAYVLKRGVYDAPAERVDSDTPASLPPMADGLPRNRLGLARWLTDPGHPLTARVAVNRYWQMLFGRGIVATPNDFGSQGELPSHPELLDWLARTFVQSGWDVKALLKQLVMSATYRQSGECSPSLRAQDPGNTLLARGPSQRLSAEMIRDSVLFTSELLVEKRGGPPVKPYQPEGLWEEKGSATYQRDEGEGSHRRSLYTYWKRTSPPPSMLTLDAAKRDVCAVQRQSTATPLQSLVLLNDPQYVEAARALAQLVLAYAPESIETQLHYVFRKLTSRVPEEREFHLLQAAYDQQREYYENHSADAEQLLAIGDHPHGENIDPAQLAAMTMVVEIVTSFAESVTK
ncbi:MAG: DUF1553 domain-containing protein [Planctomycetales bacterium]|nr:DUF1553 domain-containing protein [Planctomycetales bacterium]